MTADSPASVRNNVLESTGKGFDFGSGGLAALTQPPTFTTVEAERAYLKERLVAAIRIFAHEGFDHTVVRDPPFHRWVLSRVDGESGADGPPHGRRRAISPCVIPRTSTTFG